MPCKDREERREKHRLYCLEHREERAERSRKWRADNPDRCKEYASTPERKEKERERQRNHIWTEEQKQNRKATKAIYRASHIESVRIRERLKEKARDALKRGGATAGNSAQVAEIYRKAREEPQVRCYLCNKMIPMGDRHVDHITPLSKGGEHRPSNLAVACKTCNLKKSAKLPAELGLLL